MYMYIYIYTHTHSVCVFVYGITYIYIHTAVKVDGAKKINSDGRWRSLAVKSLFLADGATPNSIAIFGK